MRRDCGDWADRTVGASFSIISIATGITTLFSYGLNTGGPTVIVSGWIFVCFWTGWALSEGKSPERTRFVALSMAEITSAVPTAGGPYYWSAMLASERSAPFMSFATGWFSAAGRNLLV